MYLDASSFLKFMFSSNFFNLFALRLKPHRLLCVPGHEVFVSISDWNEIKFKRPLQILGAISSK